MTANQLMENETMKNPYELTSQCSSQHPSVMSYKDFLGIYKVINEAELYYPNFNDWYFRTVVDGVISGDRKIIIEHSGSKMAGIAIIKNSHHERKLCNLTVFNGYRNKGLGIKLFKKVFVELETEKPFFTISEEKLPEFKKIFEFFNFKQTSDHLGLYRPNSIEYFYNERGH